MDTDTALATGTIISLVLCCLCGVVTVWRNKKQMKPSRSDTDLQSMIESV